MCSQTSARCLSWGVGKGPQPQGQALPPLLLPPPGGRSIVAAGQIECYGAFEWVEPAKLASTQPGTLPAMAAAAPGVATTIPHDHSYLSITQAASAEWPIAKAPSPTSAGGAASHHRGCVCRHVKCWHASHYQCFQPLLCCLFITTSTRPSTQSSNNQSRCGVGAGLADADYRRPSTAGLQSSGPQCAHGQGSNILTCGPDLTAIAPPSPRHRSSLPTPASLPQHQQAPPRRRCRPG